MQNVVTIISNVEKINENLINKVFRKLEKKKALIENFTWLAEEKAVDIIFSNLEIALAEEVLAEVLNEMQIDFFIQQNQNRKKKLLISDMDSTMIEQECIDEIADELGLKDQIALVTEKAMNGELEFKQALEERVALLSGLDESALNEVYQKKITMMPGAKELLATMKKNGAYTVLVSGGFTFFTGKVKDSLGFDEEHANSLEIINNKLSGKVIHPILDKEVKLEVLQKTCQDKSIDISESIAVGDGANDLPMLISAGIGVAYRAKPAVQQQVKAKINYSDLTALLYIQGYKQSEFV